MALKVEDVAPNGIPKQRAVITQRKTGRPVHYDLTKQTREAISRWMVKPGLKIGDPLFPSGNQGSSHLSTRQYSRIVDQWVSSIGLDPRKFGTHSLRRTKAALIYRETGNLRAVQLLLGHTKLESTIRYLGIEVEDALDIAERIDLWHRRRW